MESSTMESIPRVTDIIEDQYLKKICMYRNWHDENIKLGPNTRLIYNDDVFDVVYHGKECSVTVDRIYKCEHEGQTFFISYKIQSEGDDCEVDDHPYFEHQIYPNRGHDGYDEDEEVFQGEHTREEFQEFIDDCFKVLSKEQLILLIPSIASDCDYNLAKLAPLYKAVYGDMAKENLIGLIDLVLA